MKKSVITFVFLLSGVAFAANEPLEGKSRLWGLGNESSLVIEGDSAEKLYQDLSVKPKLIEDADTRALLKAGQNYSCFSFLDRELTQCVLGISDPTTGSL